MNKRKTNNLIILSSIFSALNKELMAARFTLENMKEDGYNKGFITAVKDDVDKMDQFLNDASENLGMLNRLKIVEKKENN